MTQAGGPAAINGFLFQILHHLGLMADVSLCGTLDGAEIVDARLVLEPRKGGDAHAEASGVYLVEQYKTRENGTWAVADIISVLSDLRKAVPIPYPANACYRFVTDGNPGRLDSFNAFHADVKSAAGPDHLDRSEERAFGKNLVVTNREFFDHIVSTTRPAVEFLRGDELATVFHLLGHFELEFGSSSNAKAARVDQLLRRYAPDLGDERGLRERLVGVLVETLSMGETVLTPADIDAMFRDVGLNTERLHRLANLAETMGARTRCRLTRVGYRPSLDVRDPPRWPKNKQVLLIAGASGSGKTWQLGQLLETLGQSREIATLVLAGRSRDEVLADAARDLWQTGLHETSEKSLVAISQFLSELVPDASTRQITIAVDDVQSVDLARALAQQDWTEWGMRLVLTVPRAVARALELTEGDAIHVQPVSDFSVDELDRLLQRRGRRWADLPSDLKKLLRNPIMAGLFLGLPYHSIQCAPRSEYEIFEAFWARIAAKGRPGDEGVASALAESFVDGRQYPLLRHSWHEVGLTEDSLARLDAAGWLRVDEDGEVAFAHDRLLNWAVAKVLVRQHRSGRLKTESLASFLSNDNSDQDQSRRLHLAYVLMDTLWLLAEDEQDSELLSSIVERIEDSEAFGSCGEELYTHLLPTLGQRAVPILIERLNAIISDGSGDFRIKLIGQAFANLARQDDMELSEVVDSLLRTESRDYQSVAIAVLIVASDAAFLDRLWEIHQRRFDALEDRTGDAGKYHDYKASFAALRASVARSPEWLRRRILSADPEKEQVSELGYLLNSLEHADAPAIWKDVGDALLAKTPAGKPRSLINCIARFGDHGKLDFVTQHLSQSEDFGGGAALYALSVLDPRAAIERFVEVGEMERNLTRSNWLPGLLRAEPQLTRKRVLALAESEPDGRRIIEMLFGERPDEMNEAMLRFVLRTLESDLREHLDAATVEGLNWLNHPLSFLGRITRPDLLAILQAEAGGELERMITTVACSRLSANSRRRDNVFENAWRIVVLIGGEGTRTLLRQQLESERHWVRHRGLEWAYMLRDDCTVERLANIARRSHLSDAGGDSGFDPHREYLQATAALAAVGADAVLVNVFVEVGIPEFHMDLAELRAYLGPMPKALTENAAKTLINETVTDKQLLIAIGIAWMSGDPDLAVTVRGVLRKADPASKLARVACYALQKLDDQSEDFAQLAFGLAQTRENAKQGLDSLASLSPIGLELLGDWLQSLNSASRGGTEECFVIRVLYEHAATRKQSVAAALKSCRRGRHFGDAPYDIAAEANDPVLRDQIIDKAFAGRSFVATEPLRAIEGLAKFDTARAVDAIELALESQPKLERQLCRLLIRVAPEAAARKLVQAAVFTDRDSLRRNIGRSLRRLDPKIVSPMIVDYMKGSASERKAAAQLASWLSDSVLVDALDNLADRDSDGEIRDAALLALEQHRKEANVRVLLDAFRTASYDRRWSLLTTILNAADPYLLVDSDDSLWLGNVLSDSVPAIFKCHASRVLRQRRQRDR